MIKNFKIKLEMLPELLDFIVLKCDVDTIKSFALSSKYFYQLMSTPKWWNQKSIHDDIAIIDQIYEIKDCHDPQHQHYPSSDKSHFNMYHWVKYYKQCYQAKIDAINTILVNEIDFSINLNAVIKIRFKNKALLPHHIETVICKKMKSYQLTNWTDTVIIINSNITMVKACCNPDNLTISYNTVNKDLILYLTSYYSDENAMITNEKNEIFKESYSWKVASYLGHIKTEL